MRYLLILMGAIVVALAAKMASENLWWIAIPDAIFGLGVAWMAAASLHEEHHPHLPPRPAEAPLAPAPEPPPPPAAAAPPPLPTSPPPVPALPAEPRPARRKGKRRRR